jgi:D-alanyl-lipoteichoic acid acyltransferase DltB (MBOAT superfamily)
MGTASFEFLLFALIVIVVFNLNRTVTWRQSTLLIANLVFLSFFSHHPAVWIPFASFLAFGFLSLRLMQNSSGRALLIPVLIAGIAAFVWLKKYTFVPPSLLVHSPYITLGLSYVFFRVLHLIIDAANDRIEQRVSLVSYLNYTLNFTTFISGPIQRYQDFSKYQLAPHPLQLDIIEAGKAFERIVVGFFKVNVLSLMLSMEQTRALNALHSAASFDQRLWHGIIIVATYPLYLYCNFSGYIDMVIGIARFLRMELPENFNRPFSAGNFMLFWSRWHITLSEWLKNYVYNPLLMSAMRKYPSRALEPFLSAFAIFVTFFLVGVWHGQTTEFLFFGLLQGSGVAAVQLYQMFMVRTLGRKRYKSLGAGPAYHALARGFTFTWFAFTLLWFWSNWTQIGDIMATLSAAVFSLSLLAIFLGATIVLELWERIRMLLLGIHIAGEPLVLSRYTRTVWNTAAAVIAIAVTLLMNAPAPELVYKAF